ncbi:hypothetical protein K439DRAFT_1241165, partial [Ramaria rubella]
AHPTLVVSMFMVLILSLLGGLQHRFANFSLRSHKLIMDMSFSTISHRNPIPADQQRLLDGHPIDVRTARKHFDLEANVVTFAACLRCSCLYPPI